MQVSLDKSDSSVRVQSLDGNFIAEYLPYPSDWMAGTIIGKKFDLEDERQKFVTAILASIEQVAEDEQRYSTCTDGRRRLKLANDNAVPPREQLVGTDTMAAFVAAESLGMHFYGHDLYAPVEIRIRKVVQHLLDNNYMPTAHIACGAAGGFTTVVNRATQFIKDENYVTRLKHLTDGHYSDTLHNLIVGSYQSRLVSGVYEGYRDGLVTEIVQEMTGLQAVEFYDDDGRGVHGHREQAIVYLDQSMQGLAINPNALTAATDVQVFGVNSSRIDAIARVMSQDDIYGIDYLTARLAIEDFSSAGHGTLASNMETLVVSRVVSSV